MAVPYSQCQLYASGTLQTISPLAWVSQLLDEADEAIYAGDVHSNLTTREIRIINAMRKLMQSLLVSSTVADGNASVASAALDVMGYMNDNYYKTQIVPTLELKAPICQTEDEMSEEFIRVTRSLQLVRSATRPEIEFLALLHQSKMGPKCFIDPSSIHRVLWDVVVLLLVLVDSITVPYDIAYHFDSMDEDAWYWFGTLLFAIDIVLNFFTGYIAGPLEKDHGRLVKCRLRIIKNYLFSWFIIDFGSTFPFAWAIEQTSANAESADSASGTRVVKVTKMVKLARFLRLARMLKLMKLQALWDIVETVVGNVSSMYALHLIKVLLAVLYLCHWNACIWWAVGSAGSIFSMDEDEGKVPRWTTHQITKVFANKHGEEWTSQYSWADSSFSATDRYIFCFYWTLGVMRTMPAEVFPVNWNERAYALIFLFIALIYFAICISRVTQIYAKMGGRRADFEEQYGYVKNFLHINNVESDVCLRIRQFLEYQFAQRRIFAKESNMICELSETLSTELKCALYQRSVKFLVYFHAVPVEVLHAVVLLCYWADVGPQEMISNAKRIASRVSIIESGAATPHDTKGGYLLLDTGEDTMGPGSCIDEDCLILSRDILCERNIWAVSFCGIIVIEKSEFYALRMTNPQLNTIMDAFARTNVGFACVRRVKNRRRASRSLICDSTSSARSQFYQTSGSFGDGGAVVCALG